MGNDGGRDPSDSLRGLAAAGPSKVGVQKAMRARDVSRPHDEAASGSTSDAAAGQSDGGDGSGGSSPDSS